MTFVPQQDSLEDVQEFETSPRKEETIFEVEEAVHFEQMKNIDLLDKANKLEEEVKQAVNK